MIEPARAALILIDMQNGFIDAASPLCIAGAAASVPACACALGAARAHGMAVFHVRRQYAADGSDVEAVRWEAWAEGGRPLSAVDPKSLECPSELAPLTGEPIVMKPSWSAFFGTELAMMLRAKGIDTLVLAGTTTPNCVRSTAYDGLARGFNVAVLRDATSSRTPEAQQANLADMACAGIQLLNAADLAADGLLHIRDTEAEVARAVKLERRAARRQAPQGALSPTAHCDALATPRLDAIETVSTGWINKYILHYTTPDGRPYEYEGTSRKEPEAYEAQLRRLGAGQRPVTDAVGMVPVLPDGSVLLIREFRYPLNSWCISFPAGLIDAGETIREAVARELEEETGYRLREDLGDTAVRVLPQTGFSSTGMSEESVQVVYAFVEPGGAARPEDAEHICPFVLRRSEIRHFLDTNETPIGTRCQLILEAMAL
ncbi:isochorismatase family protein [Adlercreutzia sp. R25]|uniref:Isochorismatase family protein n=1 Tax=Adlercreutzia shanghongiae TaxID=3111773 RepID=A0ABU6IXS2_9ACTN|nr:MULTISPECIES: isochorismatase family protein [unclassified Adlercreutzia]MEC4272591.1 isochorismatase family protein [Adlercreutzia sp. R25]MEC4294508.1 isochorismatase family protein [Adlercreutzia sp. R22]